MENLNACEVVVGDTLLSALHLFSAALDTDDPARGANARSEKIETTEWTTADLDYSPAFPHPNLIKQPA